MPIQVDIPSGFCWVRPSRLTAKKQLPSWGIYLDHRSAISTDYFRPVTEAIIVIGSLTCDTIKAIPLIKD